MKRTPIKKATSPNVKPDPPEVRLARCSEKLQRALVEENCQLFTALKVGNAETPLGEVAGFPILIKLACNDSQTRSN
jgi:hypothetical protein